MTDGDSGTRCVRVVRVRRVSRWGFWSPIIGRQEDRVEFDTSDFGWRVLAQTDKRRILGAINAVGPVFPAGDIAMYAAGGFVRYRVLWLGMLNDVFVLGLSVLVVVSKLSSPRDRHARRDPVTGRCARCGYSLAGLNGPRCPECGLMTAPA